MNQALLVSTLLLTSSLAHGAELFEASLDGASEVPAVPTPGSGRALIAYDAVAQTMQLNVWFQDLIGTTTASHIHGPSNQPFEAANFGVMTTTPSFPGFPTGVTSGSYSRLIDLTDPASYRAAFLTGFGGSVAAAETVLIDAIRDGKAYLNIHTSSYGGGEIRGYFQPVPEPGTWVSLITIGGLVVGTGVRRWRSAA